MTTFKTSVKSIYDVAEDYLYVYTVDFYGHKNEYSNLFSVDIVYRESDLFDEFVADEEFFAEEILGTVFNKYQNRLIREFDELSKVEIITGSARIPRDFSWLGKEMFKIVQENLF